MPPAPPVPPAPLRRRRRRWPRVLAALLVLGLVFVAGTIWAGRRDRDPSKQAGLGSPTPARHSPTPSPPPSLLCQVGYKVTDLKLLGFYATVTIKNSGSKTVAGWTLVFDLPEGEKLKNGLLGEWSQDGTTVTVRDAVINGTLTPGKSVDVGFYGTYRKSINKPDRFALNDVACDLS